MELLNSGRFALCVEMIDMSGILSDQSAVLALLQHSSKTVSFAGVVKTAVKTFHQNCVSFLETHLGYIVVVVVVVVGSVVEFAVLLLIAVAGVLNVVGAVGLSEMRYVAMKSV